MSEIYDFNIHSLQGGKIDFSAYRGKVLLLVNSASQCGFTPQYEGLQKLHEQYKDRGLVIVGFPCNQFGKQEPGDAKTIAEGCLINYGVGFPISEKIEVNGPGAHPVFAYLREALPGLLGNKIKWNFTKFLIARDGTPLKRYASVTKPEALVADIERALAQPK